MRVDRRFENMHGQKLAVLADRVARKTESSPYLNCPTEILEDVRNQLLTLQGVLADSSLKRKARTEAIRSYELPLKASLKVLADYIEGQAQCKSDIYTTGFRPLSEQRK
ncbi:MAG: hypothetical protein R2792_00375 [Saprospiraceae bacterium]